MPYSPVDQGISNLYSSTVEGQTSAQVKQLQQALIAAGYNIPAGATGFYGPQTKAALDQWKGKLSGGGTQGTKSDTNQPLTNEEYDKALADNPVNAARIAKGNTAEALAYAASSGDLSQLVNEYGQPFSLEDQQAALAQGMEDNKLFYEAQQANDKAQAENALAQKQADYQDYLLASGEQFQTDKTKLDQSAADTGMLFSTARNQKEQKLQQSYQQDQASKLGSYGRDVANTAQNYQYQYGNDAASGLSQYYNAGSNTYNPSVATGGVTTGGLSSIYNPSQFNFQGTQNVARKTAAQIRAANYLANKGNKLLSTSYNTQL
jgi:hypothetical protein